MMLHRLLSMFPAFEPVRLSRKPVRLHALDGIRGWASLMVVCFHMIWETFGNIVPVYRNPFTATLLDGELAVSIFFVLSGEALSIGFFAGKGRRGVISLAIKRYPRLVIPVFFASLLTLLVYDAGLVHNVEAGQIVDSPDWLQALLKGNIDFRRVLSFSFLDVFITKDTAEYLIPFLWTMRLEMVGSIVIFFVLYIAKGSRMAWPIIVAVTLVFFAIKNNYAHIACFLSGMCFSFLRLSGAFERVSKNQIAIWLLSASLVFVFFLNGYSHSHDVHRPLCPIFAVFFVMCFSTIPALKRFMENPLSQFLGVISFPLFLVQFPVLVSFTSALILLSSDAHLTSIASMPIAIISVAICVLAAMAFEPVEVFTKVICQKLSDAIVRIMPPTSVQQVGSNQ